MIVERDLKEQGVAGQIGKEMACAKALWYEISMENS